MAPEKIGQKSGEHFLTEKQLSSLATHLTGLDCYDHVFTKINEMKDRDTWVEFLEDDPFKVELPAWVDELHPFEKMLLFKGLRSEKLELCMKQQVASRLGVEQTKPPAFDLEAAFEDSSCITPLIFVLSAGADPLSAIEKLAKSKGIEEDRFKKLSLGQGQGKIAEQQIEKGKQGGHWIVLQNCHLAGTWMPSLELIQELQEESKTNPGQRLWLTSMPTATFPVPVLQSGVKMTNEPPNGMRANLIRTFLNADETAWLGKEEWEGTDKTNTFRKLFFALAFFHAAILERRKFGPIGWNIPYDWMDSDLDICQLQLQQQIEESDEIPQETLTFLISVVN